MKTQTILKIHVVLTLTLKTTPWAMKHSLDVQHNDAPGYIGQRVCNGAYMWMDPADHGHDDHDFEHEFEEAVFGHYFNEADADGDGLLDMTELETLAETMNNMEGDVEMDLMIEIYMTIFDEDEDGVLSVEEFTEMMEMMMSMDEDGHDEHDDHDHGDHDDENSGDHDDHDDDMNMTAMAEMMFAMFDTNEDGSLDESRSSRNDGRNDGRRARRRCCFHWTTH